MAAYGQSKLATTSPEDARSASITSDKSAEFANDPRKLKDEDIENRGGVNSDSEGEIGRQIELEAENTIKYRTCSWQKVCREYCPRGDQCAEIFICDRLPLCSFLSTSVWLSCHSQARTPFWGLCRV